MFRGVLGVVGGRVERLVTQVADDGRKLANVSPVPPHLMSVGPIPMIQLGSRHYDVLRVQANLFEDATVHTVAEAWPLDNPWDPFVDIRHCRQFEVSYRSVWAHHDTIVEVHGSSVFTKRWYAALGLMVGDLARGHSL